jgi:hypothetical protein
MKVYRILVQRPTRKSAETLVEYFCKGDAEQTRIEQHYRALYPELSIVVKEIKDLTDLTAPKNEGDNTTIVKSGDSMYGPPNYRFPLNSLDKSLQELLTTLKEQEKTVSDTRIAINKAFGTFLNEASYSNTDHNKIVSVRGYLQPIVLPKLKLGVKKDEE